MILNPILKNDPSAINKTADPHVLFFGGKYTQPNFSLKTD